MGFCRVMEKAQISQLWQTFLKQPNKAARQMWFQRWVMNSLAQRLQMAFGSFYYAPQIIENLYELTLTDRLVWWKGLVGHQLRRNPDDIRQLNRLDQAQQNNVQFNVAPGELHRLQAQAPVPL